jgi:uncharacterized protein
MITGSIITALIGLGYRIADIEKLYFEIVSQIMTHRSKSGRSRALAKEAIKLFRKKTFSASKLSLGIVCTSHGLERPMIFKCDVELSHGRSATYKPSFGCSIADAAVASRAAYPFFEMAEVDTAN